MMSEIEGRTLADVFSEAVARYADQPLLVVPSDPERAYHRSGYVCSYAAAAASIDIYAQALRDAGYGHGHRIAVLLENRPEMLLLKLACSRLGISWVPVNPDYRPAETGYLIADSGAALAITVADLESRLADGIRASQRRVPIAVLDGSGLDVSPSSTGPPLAGPVHAQTEASLIYTSGTTGRPKGCILGNEYELALGEWYATRGGRLRLEPCAERVYNPLPLFHVNAGIVTFHGLWLHGNCQVVPERFSRARWWDEIRATHATGIHYLGVVIPVLMNEPASERDRNHGVRFGFGAGVEPTLHRPFEERFGFPLVEVWGMTEACRVLADCHEPRRVDTRAIGRAQPTLEVRVVDAEDRDVPTGEPGEMLVRHSAGTPRKLAFSGYLNEPEATEEAWRGGWFHTGDTVTMDDTGMVYFVDRRKNIIRRSGENIAAAEVEACLHGHGAVAQVAVIAVEDALRDEEVMACVVARDATDPEALAAELFEHCNERLAYYKAPGWVVFVESLPVTGTQKVLKHMIFEDGVDPTTLETAFDLRERKRRR